VKRRKRLWRPIFRPPAGRRLPVDLRADRVGTHAEALPEGVAGPGFELLIRRIDASPLWTNNRVELFFDGEKTFDSMLQAISLAREEVLVESYIFKDDETGHRFLDALAGAVSRGARVRVLADAVGSFDTASAFWQEMADRKIEAHLFHPLAGRFWFQLFRDHRKILVVDRRIGFTGGMNIGDEYGSPRRRRKRGQERAWRDTHSRVEGPAAWNMAVVFSEAWLRAGGEGFDIPPIEPPQPAPTKVLVLDSRPGRGHAESASVFSATSSAARRRLWITNSYFAPGRRAVEILARAASRGVDVRLLLPGPSDVPLVRHAGHGNFARLVSAGVRIFEYGGAVLHAKTLLADDFVSIVGSTNLDFRSFRFNAECNLVVLDEGAAASLASAFERDLETSGEITAEGWRARSPLHKLGDRLARLLSPLL
jgi:cardiolipin synthase